MTEYNRVNEYNADRSVPVDLQGCDLNLNPANTPASLKHQIGSFISENPDVSRVFEEMHRTHKDEIIIGIIPNIPLTFARYENTFYAFPPLIACASSAMASITMNKSRGRLYLFVSDNKLISDLMDFKQQQAEAAIAKISQHPDIRDEDLIVDEYQYDKLHMHAADYLALIATRNVTQGKRGDDFLINLPLPRKYLRRNILAGLGTAAAAFALGLYVTKRNQQSQNLDLSPTPNVFEISPAEKRNALNAIETRLLENPGMIITQLKDEQIGTVTRGFLFLTHEERIIALQIQHYTDVPSGETPIGSNITAYFLDSDTNFYSFGAGKTFPYDGSIHDMGTPHTPSYEFGGEHAIAIATTQSDFVDHLGNISVGYPVVLPASELPNLIRSVTDSYTNDTLTQDALHYLTTREGATEQEITDERTREHVRESFGNLFQN